MHSPIERNGVDQRTNGLEGIVTAYQRKEGAGGDVPRQKSGAKGYSYHHELIYQLTEQGAEIIAQPEMFASRNPLPEVIQL